MACENAVLSANQNDVEPCLIGQAAYEAATPTPATDESTSSGLFSTVASRRHQAIKGKGLNDDFREIIGARGALREVLALVRTVAPTNSTTLIEGETGTGKELVARAIHEHSTRIDRPFVKVNCAAIPLGLLESELFGHERGAFTGAVTRKVGRFEAANQGTLFLDEVGDIPPELQPKLLRVLQDGEFERLGSTQTQRANVRLIAATNKDLAKLVAQNQFRSDLYYRLNVFPIPIPPLRHRSGDIPLLVTHFVGIYSERMNKQIAWIPREANGGADTPFLAGKCPRATEFHRAQRHPHLWKRPASPSGQLKTCCGDRIPAGNYLGGRRARTHLQNSRTNPLGHCGPQRGCRTFGNQEVHSLLPHAKAGHLAFRQGADPGVAEFQRSKP